MTDESFYFILSDIVAAVSRDKLDASSWKKWCYAFWNKSPFKRVHPNIKMKSSFQSIRLSFIFVTQMKIDLWNEISVPPLKVCSPKASKC